MEGARPGMICIVENWLLESFVARIGLGHSKRVLAHTRAHVRVLDLRLLVAA
jgi:hypothetical protein